MQKMIFSAEAMSQLLLKKNWQLVVAESCTGGLIGAVCTELPGSSSWFFGGVISYTNEAKKRGLSVQSKTLERYGAVSEKTVEEMCMGALALGGDIGVAVSGVAGPTKSLEEKPIGCVCIGWQIKGKPAIVRRFQFLGDRKTIRERAALVALDGVQGCL